MKHYIAAEDLLATEPFNKPYRVGYFDEGYRECANDIRRIIEVQTGASAAPPKDALYWEKGPDRRRKGWFCPKCAAYALEATPCCPECGQRLHVRKK